MGNKSSSSKAKAITAVTEKPYVPTIVNPVSEKPFVPQTKQVVVQPQNKFTTYNLRTLIKNKKISEVEKLYQDDPLEFSYMDFISMLFESNDATTIIAFSEFCIKLIKNNHNNPTDLFDEYNLNEFGLCLFLSEIHQTFLGAKISKSIWQSFVNACDQIAVELLLQGKSNINIKFRFLSSENKFDSLEMALTYKMNKIATYLVKSNEFTLKVTPRTLHKACKNGANELALELFKKDGVELFPNCNDDKKMEQINAYRHMKNKQTESGSCLLFACKNKMEDIAIKIIETGKSCPNYINNLGKTSLMYSCQNNMPGVSTKLVEISTAKTICKKANDGKSSLEYVIINTCEQTFDAIIDKIKGDQNSKSYIEEMFVRACDIEWSYGVRKFIEIISFNEKFLINTYHNTSISSVKNIFTELLSLDDKQFTIDKYGIDKYIETVPQKEESDGEDVNKDNKQCVICYEECDTLYCIKPCNHTFYADDCIKKIDKCQYCRKLITDKEKIYLQQVE
jgi:hypothetical protein